MTARLTGAGIQTETLGEAVAGLQADFLEAFPPVEGEALDLSPDFYTGREVQILGEQFVALQSLLAQVVDILDPTAATGVFVDLHLAFQATRRKAATSSTISAIVYGTPGAVVGDKRVKFNPNDTLWRTPAGLVIGPTGVTSTTLTSADTGPVSAVNSGSSSWTIVDRVTGWDAVESAGNVVLGTTVESDAAARARANRTSPGSGLGTLPGLIKALWEIAGVVDVGINNNRTLLPDANGVPGKSLEAVMDGGSDEDIALVLATRVNGSAGYFGLVSVDVTIPVELEDGSIVDYTQTVRFTRVQRISLVAQYTITFGVPANAPVNASDLAKQAAAAYINGAGRGVDALPSASAAAIVAALPASSEPTVVGLLAIEGGVPGAAPILITSRQRAQIGITPTAASVTSSNVEPYNFTVTWVLELEADGIAVTITFAPTDFAVVSAATALEIADAINRQATGLVASVDDGALRIETLTTGATSELVIGAGSAAALLLELGLSVSTTNGTDGAIEVVIV